jgi:hypothetical protein
MNHGSQHAAHQHDQPSSTNQQPTCTSSSTLSPFHLGWLVERLGDDRTLWLGWVKSSTWVAHACRHAVRGVSVAM